MRLHLRCSDYNFFVVLYFGLFILIYLLFTFIVQINESLLFFDWIKKKLSGDYNCYKKELY